VTVQVRRGADRAEIYSLGFSSNAQWLAVSSDKGTVHVFGLKVNSGSQVKDSSRIAPDATPSSPSSSLSLFKGKHSKPKISYFHNLAAYLIRNSPHKAPIDILKHITLLLSLGVLPRYFSSEWSVAQFRLVEGTQYIAAFGHQKNTVVILGMDGR